MYLFSILGNGERTIKVVPVILLIPCLLQVRNEIVGGSQIGSIHSNNQIVSVREFHGEKGLNRAESSVNNFKLPSPQQFPTSIDVKSEGFFYDDPFAARFKTDKLVSVKVHPDSNGAEKEESEEVECAYGEIVGNPVVRSREGHQLMKRSTRRCRRRLNRRLRLWRLAMKRGFDRARFAMAEAFLTLLGALGNRWAANKLCRMRMSHVWRGK